MPTKTASNSVLRSSARPPCSRVVDGELKNPNCHKYATFEVKNKNRILEAFLKNSKIIPKSKFF